MELTLLSPDKPPWVNDNCLRGCGRDHEFFDYIGVSFGEGFAVEFLIDLFSALPSTDSIHDLVRIMNYRDKKLLDICDLDASVA